MISVQEHYDEHLAPVYAWMVGGIKPALERGAAELDAIGVNPSGSGVAVDLGAGFGMHAIPLARRGFDVLAIDSSAVMLENLSRHAVDVRVQAICDDLLSFPQYLPAKPELVLCMGDTLTHLPDEECVEQLITTVSESLAEDGCFVTTMRDYTTPLRGNRRFIPVQSDEHRIFVCFLEYSDTRVRVSDILHEREGSQWKMSVSSYDKLRILPEWLDGRLRRAGFAVTHEKAPSGMLRFVARPA
ncbi:MAG TPA: class I SAM-dependent methyltransferase [Woeseiaceae bacterium]|nr:class I SAM-dependent methyltransferase [Woeseiaceae bacterium]